METCFIEEAFWNGIISKIKNPKMLAKLAKSSRRFVRTAVAINENTPIHCLNELSEDDDILVQCYVAKNKNIPIETLEKLARREDWLLRAEVADNKITPNYILEYLVDEMAKLEYAPLEDKKVLINVAKNPNTSIDVLEKLLSDSWDFVIAAALKNSKMPIEKLNEFSEDGSSNVRWAIAHNPNVSYELLLKLVKKKEDFVTSDILRTEKLPLEVLEEYSQKCYSYSSRKAIAGNSETPTEILERLASSMEHYEVRSVARYTLRKKKMESLKKRNKN